MLRQRSVKSSALASFDVGRINAQISTPKRPDAPRKCQNPLPTTCVHHCFSIRTGCKNAESFWWCERSLKLVLPIGFKNVCKMNHCYGFGLQVTQSVNMRLKWCKTNYNWIKKWLHLSYNWTEPALKTGLKLDQNWTNTGLKLDKNETKWPIVLPSCHLYTYFYDFQVEANLGLVFWFSCSPYFVSV